MRRVLFAGFVVGAVGMTVVAVAQPPAPLPVIPPPAAPPVDPAPPHNRFVPPAVAEVPLRRFDPLEAFPRQTQNAVRGVLLGADWMARMNQPHGRFLYGYNPALRQPLAGDHDLAQARAAVALAQAAKFSGDERQAVLASQAVLSLLAATRPDPADANCRVPVHSSLVCNRVGFAAAVALAIYELPNPDAKLVGEADRLCQFLRKQCRPDGSVHCGDGPADLTAKNDPGVDNEHPGAALHAVLVGNRVKPEAWKTDAAKKGVEFYRAAFRAKPHPALAASLTPACAELFVQTKHADAAAAAFEMNDWLCGLQIPGNDPRSPQWAGGFRAVVDGRQADAPPGPETGLYVQSLACACQLSRLTPDLARHGRYKAAGTDAVQFLTGMQYGEANTRHFEATFRANMLVGGFHLSPADGNLRVDATASAVTGLVRFLGSGAEK
ncbi:MAG: hypothetical protein C0501_14955 [Isosphaera sp.]|nr:hypothetical protein [Isosphaera sp.]